ncbi:MAG TPA: glycosyl hydrolase, partial [Nitrospira sp.]|nr:glycosyl hydrolase [Nitrospira sp.]
WIRQDKGLPRSNAWWTVKRQAMTHDTHDLVGLYVGTTQGEIWASRNEGSTWTC